MQPWLPFVKVTARGGEFSPKRNTKVGNLEDKIMDMFGIKTQVAGSDDSYLCDNDLTLAKALDADEKLMVKRAKRGDKVDAKEEVATDNDSNDESINQVRENSFEILYEKLIERKNEVYRRDPNLGDALDEADGEAADIHDLFEIYEEEGIGSLDELYDLDRFSEEEKLVILKTQAEELEKATGQTFLDIFKDTPEF